MTVAKIITKTMPVLWTKISILITMSIIKWYLARDQKFILTVLKYCT